MYLDRKQAGTVLAAELQKYKGQPAVILAIPRGGVPVASVIARSLNMPLDLLLSKKIGHPMNKEYAIGAASLTDRYIIPHPDVSSEYIEEETKRVRHRLREMRVKFCGDKEPEILTGKIVIIVDDGIATGNTLLSTIGMIKKNNPKKIVIAVPVASDSAIEKLSDEVDEVICPLIPDFFYGVGGFYENFGQVSDEEVIAELEELRSDRKQDIKYQ